MRAAREMPILPLLRTLSSKAAAPGRAFLALPFVQRTLAFFKRIAEAGTHGYPADTRRRLKILNMIAYLIAFTTFLYAIQQSVMDFHTYAPMIAINMALVAMALLVPFAHRINELAGGLLLIGAEYAALFGFTDFFSRQGGAQLQYIIAAAACFVIFDLKRIRLIAALVLLALVLHICAWFWFPAPSRVSPEEQQVADSLYTQAAITTVILIAASVYYAFSLAERAKAETDAVLRNVLPDAIVERLKANPGSAIADSIEGASVMFADISGFVALTLRLGADKTVELLSRIVSEFDALAVRHGVEKIKTIGDAYMVVAGLPDPVPDHTARLARMGLDMLDYIARLRRESGLQPQHPRRARLRSGHRRRHRHEEVQLRRLGRAGEFGEPARRASRARTHPRLPHVPRKTHRRVRIRAARPHRDQGHRLAGNVVSAARAHASRRGRAG